MTSAWDWIRDFHRAATQSGDAARLSLFDFYERGVEMGHERPDERLACYEAGRALAARLNEPWWEMFFEHWKIETLLFSKQDAHSALDLAARAVLEVAKPAYAALPERASLNLNLVSAFMQIDPIGYETRIRNAFAYIGESCVMFREFAPYHAQQWSAFLEIVEDPAAVGAAWEHLQLAEQSGSDHYRMGAYSQLCKTLYVLEPEVARVMMGELALQCEICARNEGRQRAIASALMWRALAARWDGDETSAREFYDRAWQIQKRLTTPKNAVNFGAMAFHETQAEWDDARRVCQSEIRVLMAHQLTFLEAKRRFKKCELLKQMGKSWRAEAKRLRAVAARLPSQNYWEAALDAL